MRIGDGPGPLFGRNPTRPLRSSAGVLGLVLLLVLAGCAAVPGGGTEGPSVISAPCDEEVSPSGGDDRPADPDRDVVGWENGIWYNESIGITQSDGVTCGELELVVARTMARVEQIRQLEFESTPEVRIVPREAFREQVGGGGTNVSQARRTFANAKYEALFMVNESANALAVRRRNRGASVAGFYLPGEDRITLIAEDVSEARVRVGVLAHELVHALQDQHFPSVEFPGVEDTANAHRGVTEGDANYVEHRYQQRCDGPWEGTCLLADGGEQSGGGDLANVGLYVISFQPYSDGPPFVKRIRERGGWDAVNDLYRNPPASTEQTIHPRLYPDDGPTRVQLRDASTDRWTRITPEDQPNYETWGEAGLFSMFLYPTFESGGDVEIVPLESFRSTDGPGEALDPYNYSAAPSRGWDGDRLIAYRNDDGELAYVWKLTFDADRDAREFLDAYREVLQFRGAHRVDGREHVWRIPEGKPFADAFFVKRTGDTVLIVNAPTVDGLSEVRPGVAEANGSWHPRTCIIS